MDIEVEILQRLIGAFGNRSRPIGLHEPDLGIDEEKKVLECLKSGWVSTAGPFVKSFEQELAQLTGSPHVLVTMNGTSALHLALISVGVLPGDEVVIPTLTFVATSNAVHYCGAVPHFVDSEETTFGIDPKKLENHLKKIATIRNGVCVNKITGRPIRAIVPVHVFGHPCRMNEILLIAKEMGLKVVEDAAEALGSYLVAPSTKPLAHAGTLGDVGILSFNGNKIVTSAAGGAFLTKNSSYHEKAAMLGTTGKRSHPWEFFHEEVAFNYRMPNLNAALGIAQLNRLQAFLRHKASLQNRYVDLFSDFKFGKIFECDSSLGVSNYWLSTLILNSPDLLLRNKILNSLNNEGIQARPVWTLMHRLPMNKNCPKSDLKTAESLDSRIINLPSSSFLDVQVDK